MLEAIFQEIRAVNRTLLIVLQSRRFPEVTGSCPEGHFHLDGERISITNTHTRARIHTQKAVSCVMC